MLKRLIVRPYKDLSRVTGNFHARFLVGCERATACAYPVLELAAKCGVHPRK